MKRTLQAITAAAALAAATLVPAAPVHAAESRQPAEPKAAMASPFSVTHGDATAAGTTETIWWMLLSGTVSIKGTLQNASAGCYRVYTSLSNAPGGTERAQLCGSETVEFTADYGFVQKRPPVYLFLCQGVGTNNCSAPKQL